MCTAGSSDLRRVWMWKRELSLFQALPWEGADHYGFVLNLSCMDVVAVLAQSSPFLPQGPQVLLDPNGMKVGGNCSLQ